MGQSHTMSEPAPKSGDVVQFDCHVSSGGCSGINFRPNPFTRSGGSGMRQVSQIYIFWGRRIKYFTVIIEFSYVPKR